MKDAVAIAGIAQTPFSKHLPDSERALAARVIVDACADAGIDPAEIDGMTSYTMENNEEVDIAKTVGAGDVTFFAQVGYGGGAGPGCVGLLAMAVATGQCRVGVAWRSRKRGSGGRPWANSQYGQMTTGQWSRPWGLLRPVDEISMLWRRYMHDYGGTPGPSGQRGPFGSSHGGQQSKRHHARAAPDPRGVLRGPMDL